MYITQESWYIFTMVIQKSAEDYLEAMLMMKEKHGYIRSIDIAAQLNVTKPSVSYATKRLKESGHITMDRDGLITLTEKGMAVAASMLDRHKSLTKFLMMLGVDRDTAESDACKLEHDLSEQSFEAICDHVRRVVMEHEASGEHIDVPDIK